MEDLNNAGIRFVYFSSENELRSRVRMPSGIVQLLRIGIFHKGQLLRETKPDL